uniref:FAD/NAD(P)-binding domain-containing protein n=1 Tax=Coccolithus braarudii TaxID=221442 RepID=A0A7S0LKG6_9EUKA|mmetsp:Transcript_40400/g.86133  ORF Transcript_40400/g.86133 Transcript_40400/m.86133 type:complete len:458 (+) Transcript_40400:3-1376(+)
MALSALTVMHAAAAAVRGFARTPRAARMSAFDGLARPNVCVVGGGFGGLYTALRFASLEWKGISKPRVRLIDRSDRFAFLPMMYELTTGTASCWEVAPTFEEVLNGSGVEFVRGEVSGLDTEAKMVSVQGGGGELLLPYDQCVLALGSEASFADVLGVREFALPFYTLDDALQLREHLLARQRSTRGPPTRIVIVGGSYVGVELAANLHAKFGSQFDLTLVHRADALLTSSKEFSRLVGSQRLKESGVKVLLDTNVLRIDADGVDVCPARGSAGSAGAPEQRLDADMVVWTAGTKPSRLAASLGLPLDEAGRICTDATLRVDGCSSLYALGDVASLTDARGSRPPSTAQAAMQQADYAAWNVRAALLGGPTLAFRYADLGEMLSLGEGYGTLTALGAINLQGPLASLTRRAVYAARMPTTKQATRVGLSWAADAAASVAKGLLQSPRSGGAGRQDLH